MVMKSAVCHLRMCDASTKKQSSGRGHLEHFRTSCNGPTMSSVKWGEVLRPCKTDFMVFL